MLKLCFTFVTFVTFRYVTSLHISIGPVTLACNSRVTPDLTCYNCFFVTIWICYIY